MGCIWCQQEQPYSAILYLFGYLCQFRAELDPIIKISATKGLVAYVLAYGLVGLLNYVQGPYPS